MIQLSLPIKAECLANKRWHWARKARHNSVQRVLAKLEVATLWKKLPKGPWLVTLTRIGKKVMDDDNLANAFKAIRDGVADGLRVDDGDRSRVSWQYEQRIGKTYSIEIRIETRC